MLTAFSTAVAVVGVVTVAHAAHAAHPASAFIDSRLADPTGYPNATAALFLLAFWPSAALASRREVPIAQRAWAITRKYFSRARSMLRPAAAS